MPENRSLYRLWHQKIGLKIGDNYKFALPNQKLIYLPDTYDNILDAFNNFVQENLSLEHLSQILWAGYGCTPHVTYNNRKGLSVPSALAEYFLTGRIYVVNQDGVFRYHNRNPDGDLKTRDHRVEKIAPDDVRNSLQTNVSGLPSAPAYVILCIDADDLEDWGAWAKIETGFAAGNMLLQASALGLGCYFNTNLTTQEQSNIQNTTGIPPSDIPWAIVSLGYTTVPRLEIEAGKTPTNFTTTVNITAYNVTDLANFDIKIEYDPSVIIVTNASNNPVFGKSIYNLENSSKGWIRIASLNTDSGVDGDVLLTTLSIKAIGESGETSYLNLTVNSFVNSHETVIPVETVNGKFTISLAGDINDDNTLDLIDAIYLGKHVIGLSDYRNVGEQEGDVNCDGSVDLVDAIYLGKHVIGLQGYERIYPCVN